MSVFEELWKIVSAAWVDIVKSLTCFFIATRLKYLNVQIDLMKKYVETYKDHPSGWSKSFILYFERLIPEYTAEREGLEADLETSGCKEN